MKARAAAVLVSAFLSGASARAGPPDPDALVRGALHNWRGDSSYTEMEMTIHRPGWERSMALRAWTRGETDSLVRFTAPPGDAGNAVLKRGGSLWLLNPRLGQVVALPYSMMAQSWMGSDFSYNDLAKAEQLVTDYVHVLGTATRRDGRVVYTVVCTPKAGAPVVWGKVVLAVRDDGVMVAETFYDQEMRPVRTLAARSIAPLSGRPYPVVMRMTVAEEPGRWTEVRYRRGVFDLRLPEYLFTLSNLRNPRPWRTP